MFKKNTLFILLLFLQLAANAQYNLRNSRKIDSFKNVLATVQNDSVRILILGRLGFNYQVLDIDSALKYTQAGISLAQKKNYKNSEANLLGTLSGIMSQQGKFAEALDFLFRSLQIAVDNNFPHEIARANRRLGGVYFDLQNYPKAIAYGETALKLDEENKYTSAGTDHMSLANAYEKINKLDTASFHAATALKWSIPLRDIIQEAYRTSGDIEIKRKNYRKADSVLRIALELSVINADFLTACEAYCSLASMFFKLNKKDSALVYAEKGFEYGRMVASKTGIILSGSLLAQLYDSAQPATALKYYKIVAEEKDSLFGVANIQTIQNLISHEEEKEKELEKARIAYRNSFKLYALATGVISLMIIVFIFYRNMKQKQKANVLLQDQKAKIETTLTELKSTQAQLIQSEKMASLGELTAGIAHEIQNPLNFVNNFSEVNIELIEEADVEINNGNIDEVKLILNDIKENEQKINHHGKRADAIVKGMLQHSRKNEGVKEPTDINALCDEYLKLSYHGLRAKDKNFNADLKTDFDATINKINIVPQDISRVLLNLFNNAFYATSEKQKAKSLTHEDYKPLVSIQTKKINNSIEIKISDNGNGIPSNIINKIFQPFFTTKPTGQGTGLGLSLSYDIIKAHDGEIKVETKEGEGTTFIIQL